jgi:nucleoside-diphosphate-sugar epimerase
MKVFVTGATGYVGSHVARALRRAGHRVWGLVRSETKARTLRAAEIEPVLGDMQRPETYARIAEECAVLIHCAADSKSGVVAPDRAVVDAFLDAAVHGARPKTIVFTSGAWVYGSTGDRPVDETTPLHPARLVAWRPAHEQLVLDSKVARGLVVRPGCVYGGAGGLTGMWFEGAGAGEPFRVVGDGRNRWAMVHVDDVADGYVRVAESGLAAEIFNLTDNSRSTIGEMAAAAGRAAGYRGEIGLVAVEEASKTMGDFAEALALDQHIDSQKAVRMLGWQPKHGGFMDEVPTYFASWRAARE